MEPHKKFVYRDRWRWIEAPPATEELDIEGFAIECRVSISNAEVRGIAEAVQENDGKRLMRSAEAMKLCPPKPGFTDISSTRSSFSSV